MLTLPPGSARSHGRVRAVPKRRDSIARERLGMVEQVSRPQRLWPGLVLLLSPVALIGGLSTSAEAQCVGQIASTTNGATVTNNGCVATSGNNAHGIRANGLNAIISNSGTITTSGDQAQGIRANGLNAIINNSGTITTSGEQAHGIRAASLKRSSTHRAATRR